MPEICPKTQENRINRPKRIALVSKWFHGEGVSGSGGRFRLSKATESIFLRLRSKTGLVITLQTVDKNREQKDANA